MKSTRLLLVLSLKKKKKGRQTLLTELIAMFQNE